MYPRYINLHGNIFYGGSSHYQCKLSNDIENMLSMMNSSTYDRFGIVTNELMDNHSLHFSIYKRQIFFDNVQSLEAYKRNFHIRKELQEKYDLMDAFYEPTVEEILDDYSEQIFCREQASRNEVKYVSYNLTPKEYLDMSYTSAKSSFELYTNPNNLSARDVRWMINYNANIFMELKCSWDMQGFYNQNAMNLINSILETKLDIFKEFYNLSNRTNDMQKLVHDLLVKYGVWIDYEDWIREEEIDLDDIFGTPVCIEQMYWDSMFSRISSDLIVTFVGFDKIETQIKNMITTTKPNIYENFWNEILCGYNIVQIPKLIFDDDKIGWRWIQPHDFVTTGANRECERELKLIKKYVPYNQWYQFLRD